MARHLLIIFALTFQTLAAPAQGTFQNLNFELGNPVFDPYGTYAPYSVTASSALPGWTVFVGVAQSLDVCFEGVPYPTTYVTLYNEGLQLQGNYSVLLEGGTTASQAAIAQTGTVPANAESLQFLAAPQPGDGPLLVSLGGQNLPYVPIGSGPNNSTLYSASIFGFAGKVEQLQFATPGGYGGNNMWNIDSIAFSNQLIPEPATWALVLCGLALLGAVRLDKRKAAQM